MIDQYNVIGEIDFSQSLLEIRQKFTQLKKPCFEPLDRIVIKQNSVDEYPYVDGVGTKLIEIQKIINQLDISNCFILLITANKDVAYEIDFITKFYSVDDNPIEFSIVDGDYEKTIKKYQNTACRKVWNHLYVGTDGNVNPCCVADHRFPLGNIDSDELSDIVIDRAQEIRGHMAQGLRNRACATCYEKEDHGVASARQACDPAEQVIQIQDLDVRLNNICNFKCRMCSEYFSSAIQQETLEIYGSKQAKLGFEQISLDHTSKQIKNHRLQKISQFVTKDLKSIYFAGGEPLIMSEHYDILDLLIAAGNTDLAIRYNTNLSMLCYKQTSVIEKWRQFNNVTVNASIDASDAVAEYMRHGTVWRDIVANIDRIKTDVPHVKLKIASVASSLTIENLIDLQNHWINQQLFSPDDFQVRVLTSPNFFSPAVLPQHHKQRVGQIIQHHMQRFEGSDLAKQWNDVLQWMNRNDYTFALEDFAHRTRVLDAHRKESFEEIFPQYKDLI